MLIYSLRMDSFLQLQHKVLIFRDNDVTMMKGGARSLKVLWDSIYDAYCAYDSKVDISTDNVTSFINFVSSLNFAK